MHTRSLENPGNREPVQICPWLARALHSFWTAHEMVKRTSVKGSAQVVTNEEMFGKKHVVRED